MRRFLFLALALSLSGCGTFSFLDHSPPPSVFVVFFPDRSTTLTQNGQKIVDDAARAARGTQMVQLTGPSTKVAPGYDPSLAEPRIEAIEQQLIADGVPKTRLVRASETTDGLNVKSDPSGAQRVEIRLVDKAP